MLRTDHPRLALVTLALTACSAGGEGTADATATATAATTSSTAGDDAEATAGPTSPTSTGDGPASTSTTAPDPDTGDATAGPTTDEPGDTTDAITSTGAISGPAVDEHDPHGFVDHIGCDGVWGWTIDDDAPTVSLGVRIDFGGVSVMATADQPRPDVCMGEPCDHGFGVAVPPEVQDGVERSVAVFALDAEDGQETMLGGGVLTCGDAVPDPCTQLYENGDSFVCYRPVPDVFEKTDQLVRDAARKMMPIDLHTWSIANFDRDLLMLSRFRLMDGQGFTLFEYRDTIGAVHVSLAQTPEETARGNNHQPALSEFLIKEGAYQVEYTLLPGSAGHPSLMLWRQRENNQFLVLVGADVDGVEQGSIDAPDGILVGFEQTVTRSFTVEFLDENNAIYKSNANGFEP
jgi:hypothetical protein